jgi:hypothetical protein
MTDPEDFSAAGLELYAYTSTYAGAPDEASSVLSAIREVAEVRNPQLGITGALVHDRGRFLQVLEGEPAALDTLVAVIQRDPRHRDMKPLVRAPIRERTFTGWSMATYDTGTADANAAAAKADTKPASAPAAAIDLQRMTEAFRANFRLAALDYFECMTRLLRSPSYGTHA